MMRWVVVALIMGGIFYIATRLMPNATEIDTTWMNRSVQIGMSKDEVRNIIGVEPGMVVPGGMGKDETWYYTDSYDNRKQLAIQFIDGRVYRKQLEDERKLHGS